MSDFGGKNVQISISAGADPISEAYSAPLLVELTALPLTPWLHFRGPTSKRGKGEEGKRRKKDGRKKEFASPPIFTTAHGGISRQI